MKSQDILLVLKLLAMEIRQQEDELYTLRPHDWWCGWHDDDSALKTISMEWTYQQLSNSLGISASECHGAVSRCLQNQLLRLSRKTQRPIPIARNITEFCVHGLKYMLPIEVGAVVRGIPTTYASPVLVGQLLGAGDLPYVWPDGTGKVMGISLLPIHKSVTKAVKNDPILYELLALVDSIRMGHAREAELAKNLFIQRVKI